MLGQGDRSGNDFFYAHILYKKCQCKSLGFHIEWVRETWPVRPGHLQHCVQDAFQRSIPGFHQEAAWGIQFFILSSNFRPIAKFCGRLPKCSDMLNTHTHTHIYIYACMRNFIYLCNITSHRGRLNGQPCQPSYFSGFALLCISNTMRINGHRAYF